MCVAVFVFASGANAMSEGSEVAPGGYRWDPSLEADGTISMVVSLTSQKAYVYRGDTLIGITSIASGKPGYETPDGTFFVLEKERYHHSNKYDNAPMPYMQRLTWYGLALHGGHPHGYPASHGCIRLPMGFAAALFKEDTRGMRVEITGQPPGRHRFIARRRNRSNEADELENAGFWNRPDESGGAPARAGDDEANDGSANGDANRYVDPYQDNQGNDGYDHREQDRERPQEGPPPDLPPPPN